MKKLSAMLLAFTLVFSSVGSVILFDGVQTAEAKSYKSGKKALTVTMVVLIISKITIMELVHLLLIKLRQIIIIKRQVQQLRIKVDSLAVA